MELPENRLVLRSFATATGEAEAKELEVKEEEEAAAAEDAVVRMRSLPREAARRRPKFAQGASRSLCPLSATVKPPSREGRQKHAKTRPFDCALRL